MFVESKSQLITTSGTNNASFFAELEDKEGETTLILFQDIIRWQLDNVS